MPASSLDDLIQKHCEYILGVLWAAAEWSDIDQQDHDFKEIEYHYKTAFRHGWKHAMKAKEAPNG